MEAGQSHNALQVGTLSLSSQQVAIAYLGASKAGDIVVLSRPLHGDEQHGPGDGGFQAWVTGVTAASSLKQRYVRMHACAGTHLSSAMPVANPTSWHLFLLGQRIPPVLLANRLDRAMEHRAAQKPRLEAREVRRAIWLRLLSRATSSAACAILCAAHSAL